MWLRLWIQHNSEFVADKSDLLIILDGSSEALDDVTKDCSVIHLNMTAEQRANFDGHRIRYIFEQVNTLLRHYRYVVFNDVDEYVVLHPTVGRSLLEYLDSTAHPGIALSPVGVELLYTGNEPPLDPAQPLLQQRPYGFLSEAYCKPCIIHRNIRGGHQHKLRKDKWTVDRNIFLFHGKYADEKLFKSRVEDRHRTKRIRIRRQHRMWDRDVALDLYQTAIDEFFAGQEMQLSPQSVDPFIRAFEADRAETGKVSFKRCGRFHVPEEMQSLL